MLSSKQDSPSQNWGLAVNQWGATSVHIFLTLHMRRAFLTDVYLTSGSYICFPCFSLLISLSLFSQTPTEGCFIVYWFISPSLCFAPPLSVPRSFPLLEIFFLLFLFSLCNSERPKEPTFGARPTKLLETFVFPSLSKDTDCQLRWKEPWEYEQFL